MIPENRQFFGDKINKGGLAKPSVIEYAVYSLARDTYLQIMKNY